MLPVPLAARHVLPPVRRMAAAQLAWLFFWSGAAWCYAAVLLRMADAVPPPALAAGFVAFHAGALASAVALLRGLQPGGTAAALANGLPVGLFWLAAWSVPAFLARFH